MKIFTIGFTKKSARRFFGLLRDSGARRIVDVRLGNASQLAGFAKKDDLAYFLKALCGLEYVHLPELAPTREGQPFPRPVRAASTSPDVDAALSFGAGERCAGLSGSAVRATLRSRP